MLEALGDHEIIFGLNMSLLFHQLNDIAKFNSFGIPNPRNSSKWQFVGKFQISCTWDENISQSSFPSSLVSLYGGEVMCRISKNSVTEKSSSFFTAFHNFHQSNSTHSGPFSSMRPPWSFFSISAFFVADPLFCVLVCLFEAKTYPYRLFQTMNVCFFEFLPCLSQKIFWKNWKNYVKYITFSDDKNSCFAKPTKKRWTNDKNHSHDFIYVFFTHRYFHEGD